MTDPLIAGGLKAAQSLERAASSTAGVPVAAGLEDLDELSPETLKYLTQTSGGPIGEVWADFGDAMRLRRWKRAMKRADQAAEFLRERGREPRHVSDNVLVPLLEGGGSEEDDALADKWSILLANATDPAAPEVPAAFPDVLRQLEPAEARIMDHTYEALMTIAPEFREQVGVLKAALVPMEQVPVDRLAYHIDNLMRLRLIRGDGAPFGKDDVIKLTEFGRAFVRACRSPSQADPPIKYNDPSVLEQAKQNRLAWAGSEKQPT